MPEIAKAGSAQSQEPGISSGYPKFLKCNVLPFRISTIRKLGLGPEVGLKPRDSKKGYEYSKQRPNCCTKCLP